jgi:hypothetical protein
VTRGAEKVIKLSYYLMLDSDADSLEELVSEMSDADSSLLSLAPLASFAVDLKTSSDSEHKWAIPLDLDTYALSYDNSGKVTQTAFDEQEGQIVSGKFYGVDIPYYLLSDGLNRAEIRCYVTTTIYNDSKKISESTNYDSVYLQRISLFDLE